MLPIGGRPHVVDWPKGQEPELPEGVRREQRYPEIVRVAGFPVVLSLIEVLLTGRAGSAVELELRWRNGAISRHVVRRPGRFHGLEVATLAENVSLEALDQQLEAAGDAPGLVLDLTRNQGGQLDLTVALIRRFLRDDVEVVFVPSESMSLFGVIPVDAFVRQTWRPRPPRLAVPVAVLTSRLTGSGAEHLARMLQRHAGAVVVGERTAGAEAGVAEIEGADGSRLRFGALRILDSTGRGLQDEGVVPDVPVRLTLDDVERLGPDAAVEDWRSRLLAAAQRALEARATSH